MRDFLEGFEGRFLRSFYFLDSGDASPCLRDHSSIDDADRCLFFLLRSLGAQLRASFSIPPRSIHSRFYFYFWTLPRSRIHLTCAWALIHCLSLFSRRRIPLRQVAALNTHYSFIFYLQPIFALQDSMAGAAAWANEWMSGVC
jgi:hypothetical protein